MTLDLALSSQFALASSTQEGPESELIELRTFHSGFSEKNLEFLNN